MAIVLWAAWDHTTEFKFWRNPKLVKGVYQPLTPPVGLAGSMTLPPSPPVPSILWFFARQKRLMDSYALHVEKVPCENEQSLRQRGIFSSRKVFFLKCSNALKEVKESIQQSETRPVEKMFESSTFSTLSWPAGYIYGYICKYIYGPK